MTVIQHILTLRRKQDGESRLKRMKKVGLGDLLSSEGCFYLLVMKVEQRMIWVQRGKVSTTSLL